MDNREANQETTPSLLPNNSNSNNNKIKQETKPPPIGGGGGSGGGGGDRLKRDEWSEGAVSSLLEAYESKWVLRNRAKLKGQDWEDVARHVSQRANSTKTAKTQTQCKNKIESMKKRYRSESAVGPDSSTWHLYPRLDLLLRGNNSSVVATPSPRPTPQPPPPPPPPAAVHPPPNLTTFEAPKPPPQERKQQPPPPPQNSHGSNGVDGLAEEEGDEVVGKPSDQESDKDRMDIDSSTPALYSDKEKSKPTNFKTRKKKKQRGEELEIAESIRWLAEVIMRSEQARLETMKQVEKMRAEAEAKRGEIDLKRTEIIANTQLEIAKLFAGIGKGVDSSLRI